MVHYHKAKLLCVAFFYILVIFHIKLDSNRSFVVGSAQYYQFRQVLTAHNKSRSTFHVLRSSRQNCHLWIFKPLKALWFTKSILTVSFDKHLMRFCSSFLQMVTENQCCPQIVVSRHKIRPVQRYYKLCCCMKPVLFWVENVCEMSTNFWHQWRSLVITTLSARAIYRQIPVSYLQTRPTPQLRYNSGTTPVQLRHNSGIASVQLRHNSGTIPVQLRHNSGIAPVQFRYSSGTIPV